MKRLIRIFAEHPTAANLLMLIFLFAGLLAAPKLVRETFPDFASTEVEITLKYPGATAEEVEEAVCQRIEDALDSVTDVYEIRSDARENVGKVIVEMDEDGDIGLFLTDVKTEVEAIDNFPDQTEQLTIRQLSRTDPVVSVAVSGPMSVSDLKIYAEQLKRELKRLPGVSQVVIQGFSDHQIRIAIPAEVLMELGLSVSEIADRISRQSINLPAGTIETYDTDIVVRFDDERRNPREFEDLIVTSSKNGGEVRLGDIAVIRDRFELDEAKILFNGKRAAILNIEKTKKEDALRIMEEVSEFLEKKRITSPPDMEFILTQNVSKIVRDRLDMLLLNGLEGLLLVFAAMWLFFSFRYSFWVSLGLPVSFIGSLCVMNIIGYSLNMLTMVGLLLATGLIMDDAIVIAENVAAHLAKGKKAIDAVVDGTSEVAIGVFSSFTTTVFIFGSIAVLIEGDIGKVLRVMPVVLIMTLGVSLIEAFFILPNHLVHAIEKQTNEPGRFRLAFEARIEWFRERVVGRAVDAVIKWRYLFVGLVLALFIASISMIAGGVLKSSAFPEIDGDVLQARVLLPQGTPLHQTEEVAGTIVSKLEKINKELTPLQPEGASLIKHVAVLYNTNADAYEAGPHLVTVSADLLDAEKRSTTIDELSAKWREAIGNLPDVINITFKEPSIAPGGLAIDIRLQGYNLHDLKQASLELKNWLEQYAGVLDLDDDLRPGKREMVLTLKPGAMAFGLDAGTIANQLRAAFYGKEASEIQVGTESYEIDIQLDTEDQNSLADLELFHVTAADGSQIPLGAVADMQERRGWARIARIDGLRTVTMRGDVDTDVANAEELIKEVKLHFMPDLMERYPDIEFTLEGQAKESEKTGSSMRTALLVGIFGVFILLSLQFRSYIEPFVILTAAPLALIGVIWGHILMGLDLTMPSIMGFVSLVGIVVNDSILLVQFIKLRLAEGVDLETAASTASRQRFRAVLLTSLTTIVGLLPLLVERSLQAQVLIPLAASIVFGLAASTLLVLLVVPSIYTILGDFGLTTHHREQKERS